MTTFKAAAYIVSKLRVPDIVRYQKARKRKVTVVSLHRVADDYSLCWPPMRTAVFERLCQYWSKHYQVTTFAALEAAHPVNTKPVLILSFDDGYLDFYHCAWPILKKYNLQANMNIVTGCASGEISIWTQRLNNAFDALAKKGIARSLVLENGYFIESGSTHHALVKASKDLFGYLRLLEANERSRFLDTMIRQFGVEEKRTPMMNWDQVAEISKAGIEIGNHTATHDILTSIPNEEVLAYEMLHSRRLIEEKLDREVNILAFPNGYYNKQVLSVAAKARFEHMLTVDDTFLQGVPERSAPVVPRILLHHASYYENQLNTENLYARFKSYL